MATNITPIENTTNGFMLGPDTTPEDYGRISAPFEPIRCLICNEATSKRFRIRLLGRNIITVNNKLPDGAIYFDKIK